MESKCLRILARNTDLCPTRSVLGLIFFPHYFVGREPAGTNKAGFFMSDSGPVSSSNTAGFVPVVIFLFVCFGVQIRSSGNPHFSTQGVWDRFERGPRIFLGIFRPSLQILFLSATLKEP